MIFIKINFILKFISKKIKQYQAWRLKKYIQKFQWNIIEEGGWHFSFVMSNIDIKKKIESFAHNELNKSKFINILNIEKNINMRKDLFGRPFEFIKINDEKQLPKYLLLNKEKYKNLLA